MKLLYCPKCGDLFTLRFHLKTCECGDVKGRYDSDGSHAVVNGNGYSIAMGTGSFENALSFSTEITEDWRDTPGGRSFIDAYHRAPGAQMIAWARPHTGPANSHTRIDPNL